MREYYKSTMYPAAYSPGNFTSKGTAKVTAVPQSHRAHPHWVRGIKVHTAALFIPFLDLSSPPAMGKGSMLSICTCGFVVAACSHHCTETIPVPAMPTSTQGSPLL